MRAKRIDRSGIPPALDLHAKFEVTVIDNNPARLAELSALMPNIRIIAADISTPEGAALLTEEVDNVQGNIADADLIISALPPAIGFRALRTVIEAGKNTVSVSTLLEDTKELHLLAKRNAVTAVIDAGIAPGLSNLILGYHLKQMKIEFPGVGMLQAIHYNGLGNLTQTMCKSIHNMKQKMLRFPQHLDYIRSLEKYGLLANDPIQLATDLWIRPIDITARSLESHMGLNENDSDTIALRITLRGKQQSYVYQLLDEYDHASQISAMSRTTGYTCTAISRLILTGLFTQKGVISPEIIGMQPECFTQVIDDLHNRGVVLDIKHMEYEKHNLLTENSLPSAINSLRAS